MKPKTYDACARPLMCNLYRCSQGWLNKSTHLHTAGLSDTSDPEKKEGTKEGWDGDKEK